MTENHPLSLAGLRQHLQAYWPEPDHLRSTSGDRWLASIAITGLLTSLLILLLGGPQAGFLTLNAAVAGLPEPLWAVITRGGDGLVLATFALLFARRYPHVVWIFFIGIVLGGIVSQVPKELLDMPRPFGVLDAGEFNLIGPGHRFRGPPSGHTIAVFTLAGIGIYLIQNLRWRVALLVAAAVIGFSRIAVGAHWPLDVAMGVCLGAAAAWMAVAIARAWPAGRNLWVHIVLVLLFVAATGSLAIEDSRYPLGRAVNIVVGAGVLLYFAKTYLVDPLRQRRQPRDAHSR